MFSDHDETSPSIAAVSAPSAACSMHARCAATEKYGDYYQIKLFKLLNYYQRVLVIVSAHHKDTVNNVKPSQLQP